MAKGQMKARIKRFCSRCSSIKTTKFRPKGEQQWHWDSSSKPAGY